MGKHKKSNNEGKACLNGESETKSQDNSEKKMDNDLEYARKSKKKHKRNKEKVTTIITDDNSQSINERKNGENDCENIEGATYNEYTKIDNLEGKENNLLTPEIVEQTEKSKKKKKKSIDKCFEEKTNGSNGSLLHDSTFDSSTRSKKRKRCDINNGDCDEMTKLEDKRTDDVAGQNGDAVEENNPEVPRKKHKKKKRSKNDQTSNTVVTEDTPERVGSETKTTECDEKKKITEKPLDNSNTCSVEGFQETNTEASSKSKKKKKRKHKDCETEEEPVETSLLENTTTGDRKKTKRKGEGQNRHNSNADGNGITSNRKTDENDTDNDLKKKKKKKNKDKDAEINDKGDAISGTRDESLRAEIQDFISNTKQELKNESSANTVKGQWDTNAFGDEAKQNKFLKLLGGFKKGAYTNSIRKGMFNFSDNKSPKDVFPKRNSFGGSVAMNRSQQETYKKAMEADYQSAVTSHLNRGVGLGFQRPEPKKTFAIDTQNSKSIKFDDSD